MLTLGRKHSMYGSGSNTTEGSGSNTTILMAYI